MYCIQKSFQLAIIIIFSISVCLRGSLKIVSFMLIASVKGLFPLYLKKCICKTLSEFQKSKLHRKVHSEKRHSLLLTPVGNFISSGLSVLGILLQDCG